MNPINKFTEEKNQEILRLYEEGMSQKDIAILYNTYNTSIRRVLLRNNIAIRSNKEIQSYISTNPFRLGEDESDYFFGLLVADGCISANRLTLGLKKDDIYMLYRYANFLGTKVNVNSYFHKNHNKFQYEVKVRNEEITIFLQKQAQFINKSEKLQLFIPLTWAILRGITDGDGGFIKLGKTKNQLRWFVVSKSKKFIVQIYEFLVKEGYHPTITGNYESCYYVNLYRKTELCNFFKDLYQDTDVYLKRKYSILATFYEKSLK